MKLLSLLLFFLLIYFESSQNGISETNDGKSRQQLPVLNKEKSYPMKSLKLEKDVTYIPLETNKRVLLDRDAHIDYISNKRILITNPMRGDVFIFDMNGKAVSHFNQKGGNGFTYLKSIVYDEENEEIFILDHLSRKILVYTEDGTLKRTLHLPSDTRFVEIHNFDENSLLAFNEHQYGPIAQTKPYMYLSKKDGSIISRLNITISKANPSIISVDKGPNISRGYSIVHMGIPDNCKFGQDFVLANTSSDTIYLLKQDKTVTSLFVQYPSVFSEHPTAVSVGMITDHFVTICVSSNDIKEFKEMSDRGRGQQWKPPFKFYIYEFQTGQFFEDRGKGNIRVNKVDIPRNMTVKLMYAHQLVEFLKRGRLDGKIKEIASNLEVGDNPVVKLEKFK